MKGHGGRMDGECGFYYKLLPRFIIIIGGILFDRTKLNQVGLTFGSRKDRRDRKEEESTDQGMKKNVRKLPFLSIV